MRLEPEQAESREALCVDSRPVRALSVCLELANHAGWQCTITPNMLRNDADAGYRSVPYHAVLSSSKTVRLVVSHLEDKSCRARERP